MGYSSVTLPVNSFSATQSILACEECTEASELKYLSMLPSELIYKFKYAEVCDNGRVYLHNGDRYKEFARIE